MSNESSSSSSGGIGFFGALGLLFIGLKLGGVINWSWWWVLLPIYGPICLVLLVFLVGVGAILIVAGIDAMKR